MTSRFLVDRRCNFKVFNDAKCKYIHFLKSIDRQDYLEITLLKDYKSTSFPFHGQVLRLRMRRDPLKVKTHAMTHQCRGCEGSSQR